MRRPTNGWRRCVAAAGAAALGVGGGLALTVGLAGPARAETGSTPAPDAVEAWYSTAPVAPCPTPLGCGPTPPVTGYPKDTLHVGVAGGKETARTYLLPDLSVAPIGSSITSAVMTLPVASDAPSGSLRPETATLKACLATEIVKDGVAGSNAPPPKFNDKICTPVPYSATDLGFSVNLTPFLTEWATGAPRYGIALVPDLTKATVTTVWHVAFNGKKREGKLHITTLVTYQTASTTAPPTVDQPAPPAQVILPPLNTGPTVNSGPVPLPAPGPEPTPVVGPPPQQQAVAAVGPERFQYPAAFLLPLAFLVAGVFFFRLFTGDPTPVVVRA